MSEQADEAVVTGERGTARDSSAEIRVLRLLVDELRASTPPQLDWARVEDGLASRVRNNPRIRPPARGSWGSLMAFAAAAAAVVALIGGQYGSRGAVATSPASPAKPVAVAGLPRVDGGDAVPRYQASSLGSGSVLESGEEPIRFRLPGVADFTLDPRSRVVVKATGTPYLLALERGAVHSHVVARHDSDQLVEAFAVEVGGTRVAVHGTVFSVELRTRGGGDGRVLVDVTRGAVTVGPAGHRGPTMGHLLVGPARASFSLDGARQARMLPPEEPPGAAVAVAEASRSASPLDRSEKATATTPSPPVEPALHPLRLESPASEPDAKQAPSDARPTTPDRSRPANKPVAATTSEPAGPQPTATAEPKPAAKRLTVDMARAMVAACLTPGTAGGSGSDRLVTISSEVTVTVGTDHKVASVIFSPPLPLEMQSCAGVLWGKELDVTGRASFRVLVAR